MGLFRRELRIIASLLIAAFVSSAELMAQTESQVPEMLIDDFSSDISALGTHWEGITDRVMGGRSEMRVAFSRVDGYSYLSMTGNVSLANNGGFIQARLLLKATGRASFDASRYSGIRLTARGKGDDYYIFFELPATSCPGPFSWRSSP